MHSNVNKTVLIFIEKINYIIKVYIISSNMNSKLFCRQKTAFLNTKNNLNIFIQNLLLMFQILTSIIVAFLFQRLNFDCDKEVVTFLSLIHI